MATKKCSSSSNSLSPGKLSTGFLPWMGIAGIVILLDQLSKITITRLFSCGESHPVTTFFNLVLVYNPGAAFSFLGSASGWQRYLFTAVGIAAAIFIVFLLKRHPGQHMFCTALALILGGALGNITDRIAYGHVIDFLDFYIGGWHWPAFNIADSAICIGAILLIIDELRRVNK